MKPCTIMYRNNLIMKLCIVINGQVDYATVGFILSLFVIGA